MTICCEHVHRLELQKFFNLSAAHSPYAVASLRPKSHACPETVFSGAQTAYIGHKMPGIVHNFNFPAKYRQEMNMK